MLSELRELLKIRDQRRTVDHETLEQFQLDGYRRLLIQYRGSVDDLVRAYLFVPNSSGPFPGVLVHHQHAGQRHLGKSEVAGVAGDPLQAFASALAERGILVLAPDAICFEDRRSNMKGIQASEDDGDWMP